MSIVALSPGASVAPGKPESEMKMDPAMHVNHGGWAMKLIKTLVLLLVIGAAGAAAFVYFGVFNAAADVPHWPIVHRLMEVTRQRSIAIRARDIQVPPLDDPKMIADGAEHYSAMCTGCHLAPGKTDSEIRPGLYPQPPNLSQRLIASPAEMFWAIKHGIKMSAMPAWGTTHDDQAIWGMVAFLQKLPDMTPQQYQALTGSSSEAEEGHHHHHGDTSGDAGEQHAHDESAEHDHGHDNAGADEGHGHAHGETGEHDQAHSDAGASKSDGHVHASGGAAKAIEKPISLEGLKARAVPNAEEVAVAFHRALQQGNRDAVLALLSADVTVSEAGHTQSRSEYASGHLGEDIAFLKTAEIKPISLASMPKGDGAVVGSDSEIRKTVDGQLKILRSRELLTLKRENGAWKITAIDWQSMPNDG